MSKDTGTIVLVTGGFDPLHEGHIEYFKAAKRLAMEKDPDDGRLWVGLNSDEWLARKKGAPFMSFISRYVVISNLRMVDNVIAVNDDDNTSIGALKALRQDKPDVKIIFANGGDRIMGNVPEMKWAASNMPDVQFEFGVGGEEKTNSSSWILNKWKHKNSVSK